MATITIAPNQNEMMMKMIYDSIILDIKNGNCKPAEAKKRYNNTARNLGQPNATDEINKIFKYWRSKFNLRRRHEREEFADYTRERERQRRLRFLQETNDDFRSIPPPRSQQNITRDRVVPSVPGYTPSYTGGETKEINVPVAMCVPVPYAELDFDIPVLWGRVRE